MLPRAQAGAAFGALHANHGVVCDRDPGSCVLEPELIASALHDGHQASASTLPPPMGS